MGVRTYKQYTYECAACRTEETVVAGKCPTYCTECREARTGFSVLIRGKNYPQKACAGCGSHILYGDQSRAQYCEECAEVNRRRSNRWADPYASIAHCAANDNAPNRTCSMCEWELPYSEFQNSSSCRDCVRILRRDVERSAEYEARKAKRREAAMSPDRIRVRRIGRIEKANRKRRAEKRAIDRKVSDYLRRWHDWQTKPWTAPWLSGAEKFKTRYDLDVEFKLRNRTKARLRNKGIGFDALWRMRKSLNGDVGKRGNATIERALGYSMSDLRVHLERQFVDGMSWDSFREGAIHIDHIRPLSTFDLDRPDEVRVAWSLANLRPLWASDNLKRPKDGRDVDWSCAA